MNEVLLLAVGVALSPLPIAVLTLILAGNRPRRLGGSFALGWIAGVTCSIALLIAVVGVSGAADGTPLWIAVPELVVGLVFLGLAGHIWSRRRDPRAETPRWLAALDRLTPARSTGLGFALAAANPKNLAIALAAAIALADENVSSGAAAVAAALFVTVGTAGVALPLALSAAAPVRSRGALLRFRGWLLAYDAVVLTLVGSVLGLKFFYDGFTAL